jgi:hypothetical protein
MGTVSSNFTGLGGGLAMSLIAFLIVFLVIMGLMFIMVAQKYIARTIEILPKIIEILWTSGTDASPIFAAPPSGESGPERGVSRAEPDESELIAVITASIMAMSGRNVEVRSFTPVAAPARNSGLSAWRMASVFHNSRGLRD